MNTHGEAVSALLAARDLDGVIVTEVYPPGYDRLRFVFQNGNMDDWSGAVLLHWSESEAGGPVEEETTEVHTAGGSAARITKTSGAVTSITQDMKNTRSLPNPTQGLTPGGWYHINGWSKASQEGTLQLRIRNVTPAPDINLQADLTWSTGSHYFDLPTGLTWQRTSLWFKVDPTFGTTDFMRVMIRSDPADASGMFYLDDWDVQGPFDRPALFYSKRVLTHLGDSYTSRVVKSGPYRDSLKLVQPRGDLQLANADRPLRPYIEPTDLLAGGRVFHRLVFLDPSSSFDPTGEDLIIWQGVVKRPRRGTDKSVTLPGVGRLNPRKIPVPGRRLHPRCQVRKFGDQVDCLYFSTTTTTNANIAPAAKSALPTVADGTLLRDGQTIEIGNSGPVTIVSGGGTGALTVSPAINWRSGDDVRYTTCDRLFMSCADRERTREYQGFRAVDYQGSRFAGNYSTGPSTPFVGDEELLDIFPTFALRGFSAPGTIAITARSNVDPSQVVPFLIGRRWIEGRLVEEVSIEFSGTEAVNVKILALTEGEVGQIIRARDDEEPFPNEVDGSPPRLVSGTYYRKGEIGDSGIEGDPQYDADPGGSTPHARPQNTDFITSTGTTLSRTCYAIVYRRANTDASAGDQGKYRFDTEGIELQRYNADGTPDSVPLYLASPIWAAVLVASTKRFGFDLTAADLDMAVHKAGADYCAVEITSKLAVTETSASGAATPIVPVKQVRGFYPGQKIDVGASSNRYVQDVHAQANEVILTTAITFNDNDTVQGYPLRYEAHWYKADGGDGLKAIQQLLACCRGYVTQDHATGLVQFQVERDSVTDHLTNGNLDAWTGSVPDGWTINIGSSAGNVSEETTVVHTAGGSAARLLRNNGDGQIRIHQSGITTLKGNNWYLASGWIRATTPSGFGFSLAFRLRHRNLTNTATWWDKQEGNPPAWEHGSSNRYALEIAAPADTWVKIYSPVYIPDQFDGDNFQLELHTHTLGHAAIGEDLILYLDDWKLEGPLEGYYRDTDDNWPAVETLNNGSLDSWSAGVPTSGWSKDETGGTVDEEAVIVQGGGGSSASLLNTGAGVHYLQYDFVEALPGRVYEVKFWHYWPSQASTNFAASIRISIFSWQTNNWLTTAGTWSPSQQVAYNPGVVEHEGRAVYEGKWTNHSFRFTVEPTHEVWQSLQFRIHGHSEPGGGVQEYYDNFSIRGPIDRVPILQPGMGILKGSFRWLNDDDERRDFNQFAVAYTNEAQGGKDTIHEENDYDRQDRTGVVKRHEVTLDAVAHEEHASRLARLSRQKLIDAGSGARIQVGWFGLVAQPGGVVAIRHEHPGWTGDLKRITKRDVQGIGVRTELTTKLEVEDYLATAYQVDAPDPGDDEDMDTGAVTVDLIIDSFSQAGTNIIGQGKVVTMHWESSSPLALGGAVVKWYKSTSPGFTPSPETRFATGTGQHATYEPNASELAGSLFFVVKLFFPSGFSLTSDEEEVLVTGITNPESDPTSVEHVPGDNYIRGSELTDSSDFTVDETPSLIKQKPEAAEDNPDSQDDGWNNEALGRDGAIGDDNATAADCDGPNASELHAYQYKFTSFPGVGTTGQWVVTVEAVQPTGSPTPNSLVACWFRIGASGSRQHIGTEANYIKTTYKSAVHYAAVMNDLRLLIQGGKTVSGGPDPEVFGKCWNAEWWQWAGTYGAVGGGTGSSGEMILRGDGASVYGVVSQPLAGLPGVFPIGSTMVISLMAQGTITPTHDLEVLLIAADNTTETLISLDDAVADPAFGIKTTGWRRFAALWTATSEITGPYFIQFRTRSSQAIRIKKPMLTLGRGVFAHGHHQSEMNAIQPFGVVGNFTPGEWTGDHTTQIRVAEVSGV